MIPGFISSFFSRLVMTDVFSYILAIHRGFWIALLYIIITSSLWVYFGPGIPPQIVFRDGVALVISALLVSFVPFFINNVVIGYYVYMTIGYLTYYFQVLIFSTSEIPKEIARMPTNFYFDFLFTGGLLKVLDAPIKSLMSGNFLSIWPFMLIIAVVIIGVHYLRRKRPKTKDYQNYKKNQDHNKMIVSNDNQFHYPEYF